MSIRYLTVIMAIAAVSACQSGKKDELVASSAIAQDEVVEDAAATQVNEEQALEDQAGDEVDEVDETTKTANIDPATPDLSNTVATYVAPKKGTVFTWRNNWSNLPEIISYRVAGKVRNGDTEYLKFTSVTGFKSTTHAYYLADDFSLKGYRDKSNKAVLSFKPTEKRYRFPMAPGDNWITSWKQIDHKTNKVTSGGGVVRVIGWEVLDLPAGRFRALKVRMPVQKDAPRGMRHYAWFSPELGVTIKEEIGGGILSWSQILEKVEHPG